MVGEAITVTIDGREVPAHAGDLLIKVAQEHGVFIPRFCWHERMKPVGMCRMCLVEVDGIRGLPPACTLQVTDGMVCHTETPAVKQAQDDVIEFLLVNHPLDCPVCDRGGECPLQDQTLAFGPGESRFREEKRHWEKPIPISDLVLLDRERCIQCARCTRFADEIAGDPLIAFVDRGNHTQVLNHPDHPFASYFSGNVVQICPVGALTAKPYRFKARPWDLSTVESSCATCAVQCRTALQSTTDRLVRMLGVDSEAVNHGWLCDKGRFGFDYVHSTERVTSALVDGNPTSWPQALDAATNLIDGTRKLHGADAIAVLGGAHGTNEDAYAWARLAKAVIGTDHVDAQLGDGLPAELVLGVERAQLRDLDTAKAIVLASADLKETLPVLYLRVRRAARELGVPIIDLSCVPHQLRFEVGHALGAAPGEAGVRAEQLVAALQGGTASDDAIRGVVDAIADRSGSLVVILGRASLADSASVSARVAAAFAPLPGVKFLSALRRSNVHGALECGLAPGILPGRIALDADAPALGSLWGNIPANRGADAEGILRAAAAGKVQLLILVGADPLADFPDRALARQALANVAEIITVDAFTNESNRRAKVFLPATLFGEKSGTITNLEGRVQVVHRKVSPAGTAMDDWRIATELALRLGSDFDLETVDEVTEELCRVAPAFAGASAALFSAARDGVVLPVMAHRDEITVRRGDVADLLDDAGFSWEPIKVAADETAEVPLAADAADADVPDDEAVASARPAPPELLVWDRSVGDAGVPPRDQYALRLVGAHPLYDGGVAQSHTAAIAQLGSEAELLVSPADQQRLGVTNGEAVKLSTARGSLQVATRATRGIPEGVAVLPFTNTGGLGELVDASATVTDARVETIR